LGSGHIEFACQNNDQLNRPLKYSGYRAEFFRIWKEEGYAKLNQLFKRKFRIMRWIAVLNYYCPQIVKKKFKKICVDMHASGEVI
jgi:hypothetical protein